MFDVIISLGNCETRKNSKRKAGDKLSLVTSGELGSAVEMQSAVEKQPGNRSPTK